MKFPIIPLLVLAMPVVELAVLIAVGGEIGVLATLGLLFASAVLGVVLVRVQGLSTVQRIRSELDRGGSPGRDLVHGMMILVAGVLLIVPGFVSDAVGLLLFLPPVRDIGWRFLKSRIHVATVRPRSDWSAYRRGRDGVVDLDEEDYHDLDKGPQKRPPGDPRLPPQ